MKLTLKQLPIWTLLIFISGCDSTQNRCPIAKNEKSICDSLQLDSSIICDIRDFNHGTIEPFRYSHSQHYINGEFVDAAPIHAPGLLFNESNSKSMGLVLSLKDRLREKGYTIFLLENNFNYKNQPDQIGVLKSTDQFEVLHMVGTNGINFDMDTDSLITVLRQINQEYDLELIGASGDWCEFIVNSEPKSWLTLAEKAYAICPDIVDQGSGDIELLASEMKSTKRLYFWWD